MKLLIAGIFILHFIGFSQEILISEYYNASQGETEWIELITTENLNLVGYKIRDNTSVDGSPSKWQGGIEFGDNQLWQNLPSGMTIVIYLRDDSSINYDYDISDGLLIVNAEDEIMFNKFEGTDGNWSITSLSISREADILQILNPSDTHVHAIGHTSDNIGDFQDLSGLITDINLPTGNSLQVFPGSNLNDYNQGFDDGQQYLKSTSMQTKNEANGTGQNQEENADFWFEIKRPNWPNPEMSVTKLDEGFLLNWNSIEMEEGFENLYGYLIIRYDQSDNSKPINGRMYNIGELIGQGTIVADINASEDREFLDVSAGQCGLTYEYIIISYKYENPFNDNRIEYFRGLGRTYNIDDYPTGIGNRSDIPNFEIISVDNKTTICVSDGELSDNDFILLTTTLEDTDNYRYFWTRNGISEFFSEEYGEFDTIQVSESGNYFLQVVNRDNCTESSGNILEININEKPELKIGNEFRIFENDTLFKACNDGSGVLLRTSNTISGAQIDWLLDNKDGTFDLLQENSEVYLANFEAAFRAVIDVGDCRDTSNMVEFEYANLSLETIPNRLDFFANPGQTIQNSFILRNTGDETQEFLTSDFEIPPGIVLVSPALPFGLESNEEIEIILEFSSEEEINYSIPLNVLSDCVEEYPVIINVSSQSGDFAVIPKRIKFPNLVSCGQNGTDTLVTIRNNSNEDVTLNEVEFIEEFSIDGLPITLNAGEQVQLSVRFNTQNIGIYIDSLEIPIIKENDTEILKIYVEGRVVEPKIDWLFDTYDFGLLAECDDSKDTLIQVSNNSGIDFEIPNIISGPFKSVNTPLLLEDGATSFIQMRFEPENLGFFDNVINFDLQPCFINESIRLIGEKVNLEVESENSTFAFGEILLCNDRYIDSLSSRFIIDGIQGGILIDSIRTPEFIRTSFQEGDTINDGDQFTIYLDADENSRVSEGIFFRVQPCSFWFSVGVSFNVYKPRLTFPDTLRYLDVLANDIRILNVDFRNDFEDDIRFQLTKLEGATDKFSFDETEKFVPADFFNTLEFSYTSNEASTDTLLVEYEMISPCQLMDTIVLIGNTITNIPESISYFYEIEGEEIVELDNEYFYFINMINQDENAQYIENVEVNSSSFSISFDPFVLNLKSVRTYFGESITTSVEQMQREGKINVNLEFQNLIPTNYDNFIQVEFQPLLGNSQETSISIDNPTFDGNTDILGEGGQINITLTGECEIEKRLLRISDNVELNLRKGDINTGDLVLDINVVTSDRTRVVLYDIVSNSSVNLLDGNLQPGSYTLNYNESQLSSGSYLIIMESGIASRSKHFIHIK